MHTHRRHRLSVRNAFAVAVVSRGMHRTIEIPMLLLPRQKPVHVCAPARQRDETGSLADQEKPSLAVNLHVSDGVVVDVAAVYVTDILDNDLGRFRPVGLDLITMTVGIEHIHAFLAKGS